MTRQQENNLFEAIEEVIDAEIESQKAIARCNTVRLDLRNLTHSFRTDLEAEETKQ